MAGRSLVTASEEQRAALETLAASKDRGEADRARAEVPHQYRDPWQVAQADSFAPRSPCMQDPVSIAAE